MRDLMRQYHVELGQNVGKAPVEVGLQNEPGYPHVGVLDFADNSLSTSTGTIALRAVFANDDRTLFPGLFARVRIPLVPVSGPKSMFVIPGSAIGNDQQGDFVYVVGADDVVQRRAIVKGPMTAVGPRHPQRRRGGRPRHRQRTPERAPRREGVPADRARRAGARANRETVGAGTSAHRARQVLHRAAGPRERHRVRDDAAGRRGPRRASGLAVPADHAAHRAGDDDLSGRERQDAGRNRRAADRAAGQRRREDALHAVELHVRRPLHADGDVPGRHRPRLRAGARAEPRRRRDGAAAVARAAAGRHHQEEGDLAPPDHHAVVEGQPVRRALSLSNFATLQLSDKLARLPGVGDVVVFGVGEYSMRVWLDPQQMLQRSLMPSDIVSALQAQNAYVAAGQVGMPPTPSGQDFQITANVPASLSDAKEFEADHPQDQATRAARSRGSATSAASSSAPAATARCSAWTAARPAASRSTSCRAPTRSTPRTGVQEPAR